MRIVVKNPLAPIEHPGGVGVDCEMFELGLEQFVVSTLHSLLKLCTFRVSRLMYYHRSPHLCRIDIHMSRPYSIH